MLHHDAFSGASGVSYTASLERQGSCGASPSISIEINAVILRVVRASFHAHMIFSRNRLISCSICPRFRLLTDRSTTVRMSSNSQPITPARFAAALPSLPLSNLHAKAAEIHNSLAHLQSSNAQLAPFAIPGLGLNGSQTSSVNGTNGEALAGVGATGDPTDLFYDQDCADAIRENEQTIARMRQRLEILKEEVQGRGAVWVWGQLDEMAAGKEPGEAEAPDCGRGVHGASNGAFGGIDGHAPSVSTNGTGVDRPPEVDGNDLQGESGGATRQRNGRLTDEELRRRMQEQLDAIGDDDDNDGGGMHL